MDNQLRSTRGGWKAAICIIFVEMAERFAFYGVGGNLIMYLTTVLEQPIAIATKNVNFWNGTSSLALFIGAFFADSYLGRFKTTLVSSILFLMGLIMMTISTTNRIQENIHAPLFISSLYIMAVGDGGRKTCIQTFAADQFVENTLEERMAKSSFFNLWYLGIVVGATIAKVVVAYEEENISWTLKVCIPTVAVGLALAVFIAGYKTYRLDRPVGSPFTRVAQVIVAAFKKRHVSESNSLRYFYVDDVANGLVANNLLRTHQFRWLNKAMIIDDRDSSLTSRDPWRLCSINQVEEVKLIVRLIPIWVCTFAYAIIVAQVYTFFIKQASTMQRSISPKFQISPASLQLIPGITILGILPIYDKLVVPAMRNVFGITSGITTTRRIGVGLALSVGAIAIAAIVESMRVNVASKYGIMDNPKAIVPLNVGWLVPQFILMGLSDLFAYVGMQELFYDQMPEGMRTMGSALTNGALGIGAFMSSAIITSVQKNTSKWGSPWLVDNLNRAHLDMFYWFLVGLSALNLVVYGFVANQFVWKRVEENIEPVIE